MPQGDAVSETCRHCGPVEYPHAPALLTAARENATLRELLGEAREWVDAGLARGEENDGRTELVTRIDAALSAGMEKT